MIPSCSVRIRPGGLDAGIKSAKCDFDLGHLNERLAHVRYWKTLEALNDRPNVKLVIDAAETVGKLGNVRVCQNKLCSARVEPPPEILERHRFRTFEQLD